MKKILFAIALVLTMGFGAKAQYGKSDAFVSNWDNNDRSFEEALSIVFPTSHGLVWEHGSDLSICLDYAYADAFEGSKHGLPIRGVTVSM